MNNLIDRAKIELFKRNSFKSLCKIGIHRVSLFAYTRYPDVTYICLDCRWYKMVKNRQAYDKMLEDSKKYEDEKEKNKIPMTFREFVVKNS